MLDDVSQAFDEIIGGKKPAEPLELDPSVVDYLDIKAWTERDIPPPDRLLGDLLTTTTRMFLVGRTGLGKTLIGMAMAYSIASGQNFLHWTCARPARVLYIDGEMPQELIQSRARDLMRRSDITVTPGNLLIFARDTMEEFASKFPSLGDFAPLNTEAGHIFLKNIIAVVGGIDVLILDNVMSLIEGDQKDEIPWSQTLPLVSYLTSKRIGQIWLDHTGHNTDRQYGSATKAWRFDAVGLMKPLDEQQSGKEREVAFNLSFDHPGKSRRRTPENWQDFESCVVKLADDKWTSQPITESEYETNTKVAPSRRVYYEALIVVVRGNGRATLAEWETECLRRGLIEAAPDGVENWQGRAHRYQPFRKAKSDLLAAKWIGIEGGVVLDLRGKWS